ncbi:hypothetical protein GJAV_G00220050 [Gymnothorax javanicus]|nr:hypothetical protein GJAV_G00220050 [Gymnothorax javanicus]
MAQVLHMESSFPGTSTPTPSLGKTDAAYSVETPYGYRLDLDFLKYVNDIEKGNTIKRVPIQRRPRYGSLPRGGYGYTGSWWTSTESLCSNVSMDSRHSSYSYCAPGYSASRPSGASGAFNLSAARVEKTLLDARRRLEEEKASRRLSGLGSARGSVAGSTTSLSGAHHTPAGGQYTPMSSGLSTPVSPTPAHLQHVREQMAMALRKIRELEDQVKTIPVLQVKISVLQEEKRQLSVQLKSQKFLGHTLGFGKGRHQGELYIHIPEEEVPAPKDSGCEIEDTVLVAGARPGRREVRSVGVGTDQRQEQASEALRSRVGELEEQLRKTQQELLAAQRASQAPPPQADYAVRATSVGWPGGGTASMQGLQTVVSVTQQPRRQEQRTVGIQVYTLEQPTLLRADRWRGIQKDDTPPAQMGRAPLDQTDHAPPAQVLLVRKEQAQPIMTGSALPSQTTPSIRLDSCPPPPIGTAPKPSVESGPTPHLGASPAPPIERSPTPPIKVASTTPIEKAPTPTIETALISPLETALTPPMERSPTPPIKVVATPPIEKAPTPTVETVATSPLETALTPHMERAPMPPTKAACTPVVDTTPNTNIDTGPTPPMDKALTPTIETAPTQLMETVVTPPIETVLTPSIETAPTPNIETAPTPPIETAIAPPIEKGLTSTIETNPLPTIDTVPAKPVETDPTQPIDRSYASTTEMEHDPSTMTGYISAIETCHILHTEPEPAAPIVAGHSPFTETDHIPLAETIQTPPIVTGHIPPTETTLPGLSLSSLQCTGQETQHREDQPLQLPLETCSMEIREVLQKSEVSTSMPVSHATIAVETICHQMIPLSERLKEGEGAALQQAGTGTYQEEAEASKSAIAQAAPRSIMKKKPGSPSTKKNLQFIGVNGGYESTSSEDSSSESSEEESDGSESCESAEIIARPSAERPQEGATVPLSSVTHTESRIETSTSAQSASTGSPPQQGTSQSLSTEPALQQGTSQSPGIEPADLQGISQSPSSESAPQQATSLSPSLDPVPQPSTTTLFSIDSTLQEHSIQLPTKDSASDLTASQSPAMDPGSQPSATQSHAAEPASQPNTTIPLTIDPATSLTTPQSLVLEPASAQSPTTNPTSQPNAAQSPPTEVTYQSTTIQSSTGPAAQGETQKEGLGDTSSTHSQENRASSQASRLELSDTLMAALLVLQKALNQPDGFSQQEAKAAYSTVLQEWLRVSCHKTADTAVVRAYMDTYASISPQLLGLIVNMADGNGNTALHYTVSHSNFAVVKLLLDTGVCNVDKQNKAGYTAIMLTALAAFHSDSDLHTVVQLLRTGDVNAKASQAGQTALMLAVSHGRADMVRALISCGALVNMQDDDGSTALMCACEHGHVDIVRQLLSVPGCDVTLADNDGSTALSIALEASQNDIAVLLYAHLNFAKPPSPVSPKSPQLSSPSEAK